jgi:tetratricopeptide (TPR) repeat protein
MRDLARVSAAPRTPQAAPREPAGTPQPTGPLPITAAQWYVHGLNYIDQGDYERAVKAFQQAVTLAPKDAEIHAALGRSLARLPGRGKHAEQVLVRAMEMAPESVAVTLDLARLYERYGRKADARALYLKVVALDPSHPEAGRALEALGPSERRRTTGELIGRLLRKQ